MPTWNPVQYLRFAEQRQRPCRDLIDRIEVNAPGRVIDLGCGTGTSTSVLIRRWPAANTLGLDSSKSMIEMARQEHPHGSWTLGDIAQWATRPDAAEGPYDVVFSNAALQWVDDHATVFPALLARVAPGGALAVQIPANLNAPAHELMRHLARSPRWRDRYPNGVREWFVHDIGFYYDALAPQARTLDLWETEYLHVLPSPEAIVEWYKGTGLRPFLDPLPNDAERKEFAADYLAQIRTAYPPRADGEVLFPFRRMFLIAYSK